FGIDTGRRDRYTGVWIGQRKIASIGVHARDWVTWHGIALNVSTDLSYFDLIVPCGIAGVETTSIERELARPVEMNEVIAAASTELAQVLTLRAEEVDPSRLRGAIETR